jgi:hypothetical protein
MAATADRIENKYKEVRSVIRGVNSDTDGKVMNINNDVYDKNLMDILFDLDELVELHSTAIRPQVRQIISISTAELKELMI